MTEPDRSARRARFSVGPIRPTFAPRAARYGAAAAGLAWFLWLGGRPALDPRNSLWLMSGDWLQHWLGWLYFVNDPWSLPLGRISSLLYPLGTNIGFTDSNPLVSLLLKPFAAVLPRYVQFIGPWLAICFMLQGYVGAVAAGAVTRRPWLQWLGGSLLVTSPVLVARIGHDTLCAHWLVVGQIYLGLKTCDDAAAAIRSARRAAAVPVLAAAIHPYLAAITWVLGQAVLAGLWRAGHLTFRRAAACAALTTAGVVAVFGAIGYFGSAQLSTAGYGFYSSNALTLVNPMGTSRLLPSIPVPPPQWEGMGYLGAGGLALLVVAAAAAVHLRPRLSAQARPLVAVCVLMALYAISTVVFVGPREVWRLDWLTPRSVPFRASGRFIWPLHYLLLLAGVWGVSRWWPMRRGVIAAGVLAAAVCVQAVDLIVDPGWFASKPFVRARFPNERLAVGRFRHVALYPMRVYDICGGDYDEGLGYRYMYLAYRLRCTYNSGIFARTENRRVRAECWEQIRAVGRGDLDRETLYVVAPEALPQFDRAGATCGHFGDEWICVSGDSDLAFRRYLSYAGAAAPTR